MQKIVILIAIVICLVCSFEVKSDQKTSGHQSEFVPQWAKSAIWYQIFPERFRDGDPSNNPTIRDILGADPAEPPKKWQIHPWGSDWYKLQNYEKANGEPELWKHLLRRRYGGDLQGIIEKLDYLKKLGISAIYLNPVFQSPSLHKYDGASYHHIDPNFGPDPEGDKILISQENPLKPESWIWTKADNLALKLIEEAHQRNMKIIFDGVFNHMGVNSFAFKDLKKNQQKSVYKDWFIVNSFEDKTKGTTFDYKGWWGVKSLPEWREDESGIVKGPKNYIFNATRRWMNPKGKGAEFGIDGWRLDVAFEVSHLFWKDWRLLVKKLNPEAYLTAEIVDVPEKVRPYLLGDEFDAEMNYNFAFTAVEFFINPGSMKITASQFDKKLEGLRNLYPKGVAYANQNLFGSHDTNRLGSLIVNRGIGNFREWGKYFNLSQAANNPVYQVRKPRNYEVRLQKLLIIFQMTYVGAPMLYYGDEVGMWGANDPHSRKPMIWPDIDYESERYLPDGRQRSLTQFDVVSVNKELQQHYRKMINIRNEYKALQIGDYKTLLVDDEKGLFAFRRHYLDETIWVIMNSTDMARKISLNANENTKFINLLDDEMYEVKKDTFDILIPAKWGAVLLVD